MGQQKRDIVRELQTFERNYQAAKASKEGAIDAEKCIYIEQLLSAATTAINLAGGPCDIDQEWLPYAKRCLKMARRVAICAGFTIPE
jgi:hypothetical protein